MGKKKESKVCRAVLSNLSEQCAVAAGKTWVTALLDETDDFISI